MTTFNTRVTFDHVRNTEAGFTAANPILGYGVIGLETDSGRAKIGDGTTPWNSLVYFTGEIDWAGITGKPPTFTPAAHQHIVGDVTGLQAALDGKQAAGAYATLVEGKVPSEQLPPIVTTWDGLTGKPSTFPPSSHGHAVADVTGLQTALDSKQPAGSYAAASHTHTASAITDFSAAVAAVSPPASWDTLTGKPSTFPPSSHNHDDRYYTQTQTDTLLAGKQAAGSYVTTTDSRLTDARTPTAHQHPISDVTGLQTALDGKQASGSYAATTHTHGISDVTGLQTALDAKATPSDVTSAITAVVGAAPSALNTLQELAAALDNDASFASTVTTALAGKAAAVHTHVIADVTGLQTALDGKQAAGSYAAAVHTHGISDVTGLQTALDGKAASTHSHSIADVTGLQTALDGKQAAGSYAAATHSHAVADVTGLQTALDGKAAVSHAHSATDVTSGTFDIARLPVGTTSTTVCAGNDARLSDARTPTAHASTHGVSGSDPITVAASQVSGLGTLATQNGTFSGTSSGTNTGDQTITLTGDVTGSGTGTFAATLANSGVSAGTYTSVTVDAKGRVTAGSNPASGTKTYARFDALDNQPPATNFATLDTRNSIAVLDFDDTTKESSLFAGVIHESASLGSGLKIRLHWMATTATSGDTRWEVSLERSNTDLDSDSFDTVATAATTTSGTSGIVTVTEITLTTIDSVTAGDLFRLKVARDAANAADTMTGDAELVAVEVRSAA